MVPVLSSFALPADWLETQNRRLTPLIDYETGGAALGAASSSSSDYAYLWTARSDGTTVTVEREGVAPVVQASDEGITQIALAFDATMQAHIAYVANGASKLRYWDTINNRFSVMEIEGAITPRLCTDEKRASHLTSRDVILGYVREGNLCVRVQRERFGTEHILAEAPNMQLVSIGMNAGNRLQFQCYRVS